QVNQQIAAADEIQTGERRIADEVMPGEDTQVADPFGDLEVAVHLGEIAANPLRRDVHLDVLDVDPGPGLLQGGLADVARQNRDRRRVGMLVQVFEQGNGDRVHFLAGGTARYPDAYRRVRGTIVDQSGKHLFLQCVESGRVAEETGDADQQILVKAGDLVGVV